MILKKWNELPEQMRTPEVSYYYKILKKKQWSLLCKRIFDLCVALLMLICVSPILLVLAILIKIDSPGEIFFRQVRVTSYGKKFRIHKFRTMVANADKLGTQVTVKNDARMTRIGVFLRKYHLDELPQLLDIIAGDMTFVGTRPEVPQYVDAYTKEMWATLLLPAGITSEASIEFRGESHLLDNVENVDDTYINEILPQKMKYNLEAIEHFGFWKDIEVMFRTVAAVLRKENDELTTK